MLWGPLDLSALAVRPHRVATVQPPAAVQGPQLPPGSREWVKSCEILKTKESLETQQTSSPPRCTAKPI